MRKLSQRQWRLIEPELPKQDFRKGGRPRADDKRTIEGILWVLRTGAQWDELPKKYGSPMTCWRRLKNWKQQGIWRKIWQKLLVLLDKEEQVHLEATYLDGTFSPAKKGELK